jgi:hypothetical protein
MPKFYDDADKAAYTSYLSNHLVDVADNLADEDDSIEAILVGEFPDMQCRFVTVHANRTFKYHKDLDYLGSLVLDICPPQMNMMVMELNNGEDNQAD